MSSGSNESSGTGCCHMCATAFTADTIIHSTSTLFLRPSEYPLLTQNTNKKRCVRTETALETLMVKSEEKKKLSISISLACWVAVLLVGRLLYSWPKPECVSDIMCVALFFLFLVYLNYIFRHILHSLFRLRQYFASFLW